MRTVSAASVAANRGGHRGAARAGAGDAGRARVRCEGGAAGSEGGVGLGVLGELMAEEVEEVCGPKGRHNRDRVAYRHGCDDGEVTLGGRLSSDSRRPARSRGRRRHNEPRGSGSARDTVDLHVSNASSYHSRRSSYVRQPSLRAFPANAAVTSETNRANSERTASRSAAGCPAGSNRPWATLDRQS
jgi:hypothetical protein